MGTAGVTKRGFRGKKTGAILLLQVVARMIWRQKTVWKVAERCRSATFLFLTSCQPNFSYLK